MIPKVIHYCWFGRGLKPKIAEKCIASWRKFFPDYEVKEWNEDNYDVRKIPYIAEAYEARKYAFVSDYARFDILYHEGGVYFDTDVEVVRPMDDIIAAGAFMGLETDPIFKEGQGFSNSKIATRPKVNPGLGLACAPRLGLYAMILELYKKTRFVNPDGTYNLRTVVQNTTDVLSKLGLKPSHGIMTFDTVKIYPREYFNPKNMSTGKLDAFTDNTRTIHHFDASWFTPRQKFIKWIVQHIGLWPARVASLCMHNPIYIFRRAAEFLKNRA